MSSLISAKERRTIYLKAAEHISENLDNKHQFVCLIIGNIILADVMINEALFPELFLFRESTKEAWLTHPKFWGINKRDIYFTTKEQTNTINNGKILILLLCAEMAKNSEE